MPNDPNIPVIDYGGGRPAPEWVSLRTFLNPIEAQCVANELEANSVRYQLFNGETALAMYGMIGKVDLQVHSDDLDRAKAVIAATDESGRDDLEPIEPEDASVAMELPDDDGQPVRWVAVRAFESVPAMRETAIASQAARMEVRLPPLAPRGDAPPGSGRRFVVRVREEDVERATALLSRTKDEEEEGDDPHCPRCGSWNVHEMTHEFKNLFLGLIGRSRPQECECLKCHYVGDRSEFV